MPLHHFTATKQGGLRPVMKGQIFFPSAFRSRMRFRLIVPPLQPVPQATVLSKADGKCACGFIFIRRMPGD